MQQAYAFTTLAGNNIKPLQIQPKNKRRKKILKKDMTDLKRAQVSLHKALGRKRAELLAIRKDIKVEQAEAYCATSPVQLSDNEIEELINIVRHEEK